MTALTVIISWHSADLDLVAEPIALELRQKKGNVYLHAQIFTGFMYLAAGLSMWFLRSWKIGQLEQMAAEKGKRAEDIDATSTEPEHDHSVSPTGKRSQRGVLKRLFIWVKV